MWKSWCDSAIFPVGRMEYTRVCGWVLGYYFGDDVSASRSLLEIDWVWLMRHLQLQRLQRVQWSITHVSLWWRYFFSSRICRQWLAISDINGPWIGQFYFYPPFQWSTSCGMGWIVYCCCTLNRTPYFVTDFGRSSTNDIGKSLQCIFSSVF